MEEIKNISQGGGFIVKETAANTVFTPEDFSEEQLMMKESVQEFVDRDIVPNRERFEQKDYDLTRDLMAKAGVLGFLGVAVPEEYNGLGMPFTSTMLVCDYISGANGSFSTAFGAHTGIGTMPITLYGNEEQKQKYVSKLATGEWFGAYCLTEPGAGSDANSGKTKAVLSEDGTHYKITGQKMWISNAGFAHIFIVFARIEDDKNITGFIVPKDLENGITLGEEENKLGIKASSTRQAMGTNPWVIPKMGNSANMSIRLVDFINFIDSTDPDLYLFNTAGNAFLNEDGTIDLNVLYHSRIHTDALRGKAIAEELENSGGYQETPDAFVLRILKQ